MFLTGILFAATLLAPLPSEGSSIAENIIPNGDFSQGNKGFTSDLPYAKPANNCLWEGKYTVASAFNNPQLHVLIAPDAFTAPDRKTQKEQVLFANAGGTEPLMLWSTKVDCKPNTRYELTFYCISLTGYIMDGNPPHQVATKEWAPEMEIWANTQLSAPIEAGLGKYAKRTMFWDSKDKTSVTLKIVRTKFPHGGGLVGVSHIEMVPTNAISR